MNGYQSKEIPRKPVRKHGHTTKEENIEVLHPIIDLFKPALNCTIYPWRIDRRSITIKSPKMMSKWTHS